eukprot:15148842-Alexandrium_andersonii.AAC.1
MAAWPQRSGGGGAWAAIGQEVAWRLARAVLAARAEKHAEEIEERAEAEQAAQRAAEETRAATAALA